MSKWNFFGQLASAAASIFNTGQTNRYNESMVRETNAANIAQVQMQNEAAALESQKAYDRSKAGNQVALMQSAGMSKAGAINALNGGGSYTPAPVNTSQSQAPQAQTADFSGFINAFQQLAQHKHDEKMQEKQLQEQKRQFNENLNFEKSKFEVERGKLLEETNALKIQNEINNELRNYRDENGNKRNLLVEGAAAERIAHMSEAQLNTVKASLFSSLYEVPEQIVPKVIKALRNFFDDKQNEIKKIEEGKLTTTDVEGMSNMYNEIITDNGVWILDEKNGVYHFHAD